MRDDPTRHDVIRLHTPFSKEPPFIRSQIGIVSRLPRQWVNTDSGHDDSVSPSGTSRGIPMTYDKIYPARTVNRHGAGGRI
jgi:hypothetical protein